MHFCSLPKSCVIDQRLSYHHHRTSRVTKHGHLLISEEAVFNWHFRFVVDWQTASIRYDWDITTTCELPFFSMLTITTSSCFSSRCRCAWPFTFFIPCCRVSRVNIYQRCGLHRLHTVSGCVRLSRSSNNWAFQTFRSQFFCWPPLVYQRSTLRTQQ